MTDFLEDMQQRGLVQQTSSPELGEALRRGATTGYIGFDPTADSLHVGSLLPLVTLRRFQLAGHRPIGLVGGGTGMIGDPSGRESERTLLTKEKLAENLKGIRAQVERFLDFDNGALLVNNADWLCELNLVEFLRDVGKHFSVNQMIVRDSVRMRLEAREQGLSYTEFTYMLLQAYDFLALHERYGCTLQMGGSDQWGNILSGMDLIRRLRGVETYGLTMPLVTRADGKKFGKSEEGNIWLDPARTSPYQFYQFWLNADDGDAIPYLNYFTFLSPDEIRQAADELQRAPEQRAAQKLLAEQVTRLVHGDDALARARRATDVLFDKQADFGQLSAQELREAFHGAPTLVLKPEHLGTEEAALVAVLAESGLYPSRGRARKDLPAGAVSVNNNPVRDVDYVLSRSDVLADEYIILRKGKKTYFVLHVSAGD
ncbi:MAG: tyrosine--tRNA ligase [Phycisphaerae bacterium]|nr:tyrosine--tRNA ligase [Phycisphaerae bacterium]